MVGAVGLGKSLKGGPVAYYTPSHGREPTHRTGDDACKSFPQGRVLVATPETAERRLALVEGPQPPRPRSPPLTLWNFEEKGKAKIGSGGVKVLARPWSRAPRSHPLLCVRLRVGLPPELWNSGRRIKRSTRWWLWLKLKVTQIGPRREMALKRFEVARVD